MLASAATIAAAIGMVRHPPPSAEIDLDEAWQIAMVDAWRQGQLAGRDFAYTYGPATQAVAAAGASLHRGPGSSAAAAHPLILLAFEGLNLALLTLVLLALGLGPFAATAAIGALSILSVPYHYPSFRPLSVLLSALLVAHARHLTGPARRGAVAAAAAACAVLAQLFSIELVVYAVVALLAWTCFELARGMRSGSAGDVRGMLPLLATYAVALLAAEALVLGFFAWTSSSSTADYLHDLRLMTTGYPLAMGAPWALSRGATLASLATVALAAGEIGLDFWKQRDRQASTFLAAFAAALVCLKGGTVRADLGHVALAATPLVVVLVARTLALAAGRRWWALAVIVSASSLVPGWWPYVFWHLPAQAVAVVSDPGRVTRQLEELRRAKLPVAEVAGPELSLAAVGGEAPLAVVPYQSHLPAVLGRPLLAPVLQAYAAHTLEAQAGWVRAVTADASAEILVFPDASFDGLATATRLPGIWKALMTGYQASPERRLDGRALLMKRRTQQLPWRTRTVAYAQEWTRGLPKVRPVAPFRCSLVEVGLRVEYPAWIALLRPAAMRARFVGAGATVMETRLVALAARGMSTTLVPIDPFGPEWTTLEIHAERDVLAIAPRFVTVTSLACVETPGLEPAASPEL